MKLVEKKGFLRRVYTQNIDTLERIAGVGHDKIVEAHGSFAANHCIDCGAELSVKLLQQDMRNGESQATRQDKRDNSSNSGKRDDAEEDDENEDEDDENEDEILPIQAKPVGIPRCRNPKCKVKGGGLVKPDIVFFGEQLPELFFSSISKDLPKKADLVIVAGTSLTVHPFASLPDRISRNCPRVLFNVEKVGDIGSRPNDLAILGDCDSEVRKLIELCGWEKDLDELFGVIGDDSSVENVTESLNKAHISEPVDEHVDESVKSKNLL